MERLVIPHLLPLADLALYGVLGAIAGSLFRVLQLGVASASCLASGRLTASSNGGGWWRQEARLVGGIVLLGSVVIWFVTPLVEHLFLRGK